MILSKETHLIKTRYELLKYLNDEIKLTGNGIEIGVQTGAFSQQILSLWKNCSKLYLMDCWQEQQNYDDGANVESRIQDQLYRQVVRMFETNKKVEIIKDFTPQGASRFKDNYFSFIYHDANHSYEALKKDLEVWWPKLLPGGIYAGHDYGMDGHWDSFGIKGDFGVTKAVTEFAQEKKLKINSTKEYVCKTWWCRK